MLPKFEEYEINEGRSFDEIYNTLDEFLAKYRKMEIRGISMSGNKLDYVIRVSGKLELTTLTDSFLVENKEFTLTVSKVNISGYMVDTKTSKATKITLELTDGSTITLFA